MEVKSIWRVVYHLGIGLRATRYFPSEDEAEAFINRNEGRIISVQEITGDEKDEG